MNIKNYLGAAISALLLTFTAQADDIDNFNNSWAGKSLKIQRQLDLNSPMSENSIVGSHNSYNSLAYTSPIRYLDPNQLSTITDQLRMGARFLELDVHWTHKANFGVVTGGDWWNPLTWTVTVDTGGHELLLCHGVCSIDDRRLSEGLWDLRNWLNQPANKDEVVILYLEDHMDSNQATALGSINSILAGKVYASGGCQAIPTDLSKADVLAEGKNILVQTDGCNSNAGYSAQVFTGLGAISRTWEDRTANGWAAELAGTYDGNQYSATDIANLYASGMNLVNYDKMSPTGGRLEGAVWSFDVNQPDNGWGDQDCAVSWGNGRWEDAGCSITYAYACQHSTTKGWFVPAVAGAWTGGDDACATLGTDYAFSVPTNSFDNQKLKAAKAAAGQTHTWLNINDQAIEGSWQLASASPFIPTTGILKQVSVGADGKAWGVTSADSIWHYESNQWHNVGGSMNQISVGSVNHVWGTQDNGNIFRWQHGYGWVHVPGKLKWVSADAHGAVWGISVADDIFNYWGGAWHHMAGKLKQISVGPNNNVWGVNAANDIFRWQNGWVHVPGKLTNISVGDDGSVWGIGQDGSTVFYREDNEWKVSAEAGAKMQISAGNSNYIWAVDHAGNVSRTAASPY